MFVVEVELALEFERDAVPCVGKVDDLGCLSFNALWAKVHGGVDWRDGQFAVLGLQCACDQVKEGGFPHAIGADDAGPTALKVDREVFDQGDGREVREADVLKAYGRRHMCAPETCRDTSGAPLAQVNEVIDDDD